MAFNGSSASGSAVSTGNSGNQDGPLNSKRLCTGKENNDAGINNNRVINSFFAHLNVFQIMRHTVL